MVKLTEFRGSFDGDRAREVFTEPWPELMCWLLGISSSARVARTAGDENVGRFITTNYFQIIRDQHVKDIGTIKTQVAKVLSLCEGHDEPAPVLLVYAPGVDDDKMMELAEVGTTVIADHIRDKDLENQNIDEDHNRADMPSLSAESDINSVLRDLTGTGVPDADMPLLSAESVINDVFRGLRGKGALDQNYNVRRGGVSLYLIQPEEQGRGLTYSRHGHMQLGDDAWSLSEVVEGTEDDYSAISERSRSRAERAKTEPGWPIDV